MSLNEPFDDKSLASAKRLDQLCRQFEKSWQFGDQSRLEEFLATVPATDRTALLEELLYVELEMRRRANEQVRLQEYLQRFPNDSALIQQVWDASGLAGGGGTADSAVGDTGQPTPAPQATIDQAASNPQLTTDHVSRKTTDPDLPTRAGHYRIVGEVARGGMGAVLRADDPDFDRTLAVKIMLRRYHDRPDLETRFFEEAQITGRLQHPGIPPVHELGRLEDERPYFAMKLIEGKTLAYLLRERNDPSEDLPHFLSIFEQICQTIAYAHSQKVIHRDLKPLNIMVGAFGEVQVMDWGLAKFLRSQGSGVKGQESKPADGTAQEVSGRGVESAEVEAVLQQHVEGMVDWKSVEIAPDKSQALRTRVGSVLGTPAYMAPEQARGEIDQLDERCDVFGLGAILCQILTGQPAFVDQSMPDILAQAQKGDLSDAWKRLDTCTVDEELLALCRKCLAPGCEERPRSALEVAEAIAAYRASVDERLQQAERDRAVSEVEARELRKRRKVQFALTVAVLLIVASGGAFAWWAQRQHADRMVNEARLAGERDTEKRAKIEQARQGVRTGLALAADLRTQIKFREADAALKQAAKLAKSGSPNLLPEVERAQNDLAFVIRLDHIRFRRRLWHYERGGKYRTEVRTAQPLYRQAFADYGLNLDTLDPNDAARRIGASAIKAELVAAVDDWAFQEPDKKMRARLMDIGCRVDPQPYRDQLREAGDWNNPIALAKLARDIDPATTSPRILAHIGLLMWEHDLKPSAFLSAARAVHPMNFDLAFASGWSLPVGHGKQLAALEAARALRPENASTWGTLGSLLVFGKDRAAGIAALKKAVSLDPTFALHHINLAHAYLDSGDVDHAVATMKEALKVCPADAYIHNTMAYVLLRKEDLPGCIRHSREAIRLDGKLGMAYNNLGSALERMDDLPGAAKAFRTAIAIDNKDAVAHFYLGNILSSQKNSEGAIQEYQKAIRLDGKNYEVYFNLGNELSKKKDWNGAIKAYRASLQPNRKDLKTYSNLMHALIKSRDFAGVITASREAAKLKPNSTEDRIALSKVYDYRGVALKNQGKLADALTAYKEAICLNPKHAEAYVNLGTALGLKKDVAGAIAAYKEAIKANPKLADARLGMGVALAVKGDLDGAIGQLKTGVKLAPNDDYGYRLLVSALLRKGDVSGARATLEELARVNPKLKNQVASMLRGLIVPREVTRPFEKESKSNGELADKSPQYFGSYYNEHKHKLEANHLYTIELRSKQFDTFLILFDPSGKKRLAQNDDFVPGYYQLSRLTFLPPKTADYVIRATTVKSKESGAYTLRILDHGPHTIFRASLTADTKERKHELKMMAGKTYTIEMQSKQFDPLLRLKDAKGKKLAENDDIDLKHKNLSSRIVFTPTENGSYQIIATSFQQAGRGNYILLIQENKSKASKTPAGQPPKIKGEPNKEKQPVPEAKNKTKAPAARGNNAIASIHDKLASGDPLDNFPFTKKSYHKTHAVKLEKGKKHSRAQQGIMVLS